MKLKPLYDKVIIKPAEAERFTKSGLEMISDWNPDVTGTVVSVGKGLVCPKCRTRKHMDIQIGDEVVFPYTAGETVTMDNEEFIVMPSDNVIAVLEDA